MKHHEYMVMNLRPPTTPDVVDVFKFKLGRAKRVFVFTERRGCFSTSRNFNFCGDNRLLKVPGTLKLC